MSPSARIYPPLVNSVIYPWSFEFRHHFSPSVVPTALTARSGKSTLPDNRTPGFIDRIFFHPCQVRRRRHASSACKSSTCVRKVRPWAVFRPRLSMLFTKTRSPSGFMVWGDKYRSRLEQLMKSSRRHLASPSTCDAGTLCLKQKVREVPKSTAALVRCLSIFPPFASTPAMQRL